MNRFTNRYDTLASCRLQRRYEEKKISHPQKAPAYITPVREGNKAFPVFKGLKSSEKADTLLGTNITDDFESMEEISKPMQKVKKFKND